jgi:hypothetical protein
MDLSASLLETVGFPTFAFSDTNEPPSSSYPTDPPPSWTTSSLNLKNRLDSLELPTDVGWRIDGAVDCGTHFYTIPTCLLPDLVPLRIDTYIPDQTELSPYLRDVLRSNVSVHLRSHRIASLGICQHICRALDRWSRRDPEFPAMFRALPFGSRIIFENVAKDVKVMRISVVASHDLERQLLSIQALQSMWQLPQTSWPEEIDLYKLRLRSQIHDSISLVQIPNECHRPSENIFVFKSTTGDPKYMYHELKVLLTMPPHPNVITRPLYVVTKESRFGGKRGVCGFILRHHPQGTIRDIIPSRAMNGTLTLNDQFKWARQITSALIHIHERAGLFYPDLRPDNILLSSPDEGSNLILVDFEQRGNWFAWCPPEILYMEYLEHLATFLPPGAQRARYHNLLRDQQQLSPESLSGSPGSKKSTYQNPPYGYYKAWLSLTSPEKEAAEVYMLGKMLWCIFEGVCNVRSSIWTSYLYEPTIEFPAFCHTPRALRGCIRKCTAGAPEWHQARDSPRMVRVGSKLYPHGKTGLKGEVTGTARETWDVARQYWKEEVSKMETFLQMRKQPEMRELSGSINGKTNQAAGLEPSEEEFSTQRPKLREVLTWIEQVEAIETRK